MSSRPNLRTTHVATTPPASTATGAIPIWLVAVLLVVLGVVVPLLIAHHFGALGIARGDDVAYLSSAFRFVDHGTIKGSHWAAMSLVGQIIAAAPVVAMAGHRITALQIETAAIGFVGLWAVFDLARQVLSLRRAAFVAALVAVNPLWLQLAPTFMTDIPAFSLAMASLALGARSVRSERHRGALVAASLAVGFAGFTIREFAIVAPIAVAMVSIALAGRRRERMVPVFGVSVLVLAVVLFFAWRRGLPGFTEQHLTIPTSTSVRKTTTRFAQSLLLLGVMVSPALILARPLRLVRASWARAHVTTAVVVGGVAAVALVEAFVSDNAGGFITPDHYNSNQWTLGEGYNALLPSEIAVFLKLVGVLAVAVMLCAVIPAVVDAIASVRDRELRVTHSPVTAIVALGALGYVAVYLASSLVGVSFFSRYLLSIVPLVAILVLAGQRVEEPARHVAGSVAIASLVVLGTLGAAAAAATASLDGTKWTVAEDAAEVVGGKRLVDGSFEWNNIRLGEVRYFTRRPPGTCVRLRRESAPPSGASVVASEKVWTVGTDLWVVARRTGNCPDSS